MRFEVVLPMALLALTAVPASALTYTYEYTYNGSSFVLDAGSANPVGQSIAAGDTFIVDIKAQANKAWEVLSGFTSGIDGALFVQTVGTRTGDVTVTQTLEGSFVNSTTHNGLTQGSVHAGGQSVAYSLGHVFDRWVAEYTLISDPGSTVIQDSNPSFWDSFLNSRSIAYIDSDDPIAPVPLPAALPFLLTAFAGLGFAARRRTQTS